MSIEDLSDEEIVDVIQEAFKEDGRINMGFIHLECVNGKPVLSGRVASDEELQIVDEIMSDVVDLADYDNTIWVDDTLAFEDADEEGDDVEELNMDEDSDIDDGSSFGPDDEDNQ